MARASDLYPAIASPDNLRLAFKKAVKGKADRAEVINFRQDLGNNLVEMREELLSGSVKLGAYHYFKVFDPKERLICAATFRERVLHHAVMNICEPALERYSIFDSYQLNRCRHGIPFLGFRLYPDTVRLARRSKQRFIRKLKSSENEAVQGLISETELARRVVSLVAFTRTANAAGFRRSVICRRGVSSEGAPTASIAAAVGTTTRGTRGRPTVTTTPRATATTTSASACFSPQLTVAVDAAR